MPKIKLAHVVSCSSEDPEHIANNLLNSETKKKWKNKTVGEASASVIFQLEKSSKISAIDIGNENSSFIEVLVGRSSCQEHDYKIILAMSSFMTPIEARNLTNNNRVRMFTYNDLASSVRDEKWDRVKVVCTQPFNKHIQYGLSFITLQGPQEKKQEETSTLGKFTLRPESPNVLTAGSLFAKRKELTDSKAEMTVAQAIKTSEKPKFKPVNIQSCGKRQSTSESIDKDDEENDRNRKSLFYDSDEEASNDRIDKVMNKLKDEVEKKKETKTPNKTPARKKNSDNSNNKNSPKPSSSTKKEKVSNDTPTKKAKVSNDTPTKKEKLSNDTPTKKEKVSNDTPTKKEKLSNDTPTKKEKLSNDTPTKKEKVSNDTPSSSKRKVDTTPKIRNKKRKITKPFIELLSGVVFTISGIVNPERATLRTLALSMGAKYRPDWDNTCTHLICAFANTPKFNQVQGKGKIVTKAWIKDCHNQRKRIPWRRYALDRNDQGKPESEDEVEETVDESEESDSFVQNPINNNNSVNENQSSVQTSNTIISGSDTDDEIEKILAKEKKTQINDDNQNDKDDNNQNDKNDNQNDPFNVDTDEEELKKNPADVEDIPKIFQSEIFYIDDALDEHDKNKLQRLIKAFDGVVLTSLRNIVDFVVTNEDSVEAIKERCSSAKFVNCIWIYECHDVSKRIPYENFLL